MSDVVFIREKSKNNFTILDNFPIQDKELSWSEKGLLVYLLSLPPDWKIHVSELVKHSRNGMSSLRTTIKGLVEHRYIVKRQIRSEKGQFGITEYIVSERPLSYTKNNPSPIGKLSPVTPLTDSPIANKLKLLNTNIQNTERLTTNKTTSSNEISQFVKIIRSLFNDCYPFDEKFEADVILKLNSNNISGECLESYLKYIYASTEKANPKKSFSGYFRKIAPSDAKMNDFKITVEKLKESTVNPIYCPECHKQLDKMDFTLGSCQSCGMDLLDMDVFKTKDKK